VTVVVMSSGEGEDKEDEDSKDTQKHYSLGQQKHAPYGLYEKFSFNVLFFPKIYR